MGQTVSNLKSPSGVSMKNYFLSLNNKVNENEVVVDKKAQELYDKIYKTYSNLNKYFQEIALEYKRCATQSVKGDSLVEGLKKIAKNCENQGKYCLNRQKDLEKSFKMAITKSSVNDLETAANESSTTATTTSKAATATIAATSGVATATSTSKTYQGNTATKAVNKGANVVTKQQGSSTTNSQNTQQGNKATGSSNKSTNSGVAGSSKGTTPYPPCYVKRPGVEPAETRASINSSNASKTAKAALGGAHMKITHTGFWGMEYADSSSSKK